MATKYDYLSTLSHDYDDDVLMYLKVNGFCSKWLCRKTLFIILRKALFHLYSFFSKRPSRIRNSIKVFFFLSTKHNIVYQTQKKFNERNLLKRVRTRIRSNKSSVSRPWIINSIDFMVSGNLYIFLKNLFLTKLELEGMKYWLWCFWRIRVL